MTTTRTATFTVETITGSDGVRWRIVNAGHSVYQCVVPAPTELTARLRAGEQISYWRTRHDDGLNWDDAAT